MKIISYIICTFLIPLAGVFGTFLSIPDDFDTLDLIPATTRRLAQSKFDKQDPLINKFIPRNVWIAVRNSSETRAAHMLGTRGFVKRNSLWKVNFCGNDEKDLFLEEQFANSSFLWAYNVLNPRIGTAKSELWRLAVLYVHGGMYMDDDANFETALDDIVRPTDKFLLGKESYNWTDNCFYDSYLLSNASFNARFGREKNANFVLFDGRYNFNWALFSAPGHPILYRIIEHVTRLIRSEYLGNSQIKMLPGEAPGKLLMCMSTFPITLTIRELLLDGSGTFDSLGLRIGGEFFREYGGNMKAWNNDRNPERWVKQMNKHHMPYLRDYAPPVLYYEGKFIQARGSRTVYIVDHGQKRNMPDVDTLMALLKERKKEVVFVKPPIVASIPSGLPWPAIKS